MTASTTVGTRRGPLRRGLPALVVALVACSTSRPAPAQEPDICLADSIEGQVLKSHGRLTRAREHLERCADPSCEEHMRARCASWLAEVVATIPVLTIEVVDDRGQPIPDAVVRLDGAIVDPSRPLPLDLGPHVVRADHAGRSFELSMVDSKPGVHDIRAVIDLRGATPTRPTPSSVWALVGASAVGWAGLGAFGIATLEQEGSLRACAPYCDASRRTPLEISETGADVALAVGAAAALVATFLYFTRPTVMKEVRLSEKGMAWAF
jgi:hypothetical protein